MFGLYRLRRKSLLAGVLSGLADKFNWDIWLVRGIFMAITLLTKVGWILVVLYIMAALLLPIKEEVDADLYGTGPRKRKDAEPVNKSDNWFE